MRYTLIEYPFNIYLQCVCVRQSIFLEKVLNQIPKNVCSTLIFYACSKPLTSSAPYHLEEYMSWRHFENFTKDCNYINAPPPRFQDRFPEIRQLIVKLNNSFWLDESMSPCFRKWSCPYAPYKQH